MDLDTAVETSKLQNMLGLAALKFHRWTVDGVLSQHREKQSTRHALEQSTSGKALDINVLFNFL